MDLFKQEVYTVTETDIIGECFDHPTIKKYLNDQLTQAFAAIAEGQPGTGESAEVYLRRVALVQGNIQAFKALLSIKKAEKPEQNS